MTAASIITGGADDLARLRSSLGAARSALKPDQVGKLDELGLFTGFERALQEVPFLADDFALASARPLPKFGYDALRAGRHDVTAAHGALLNGPQDAGRASKLLGQAEHHLDEAEDWIRNPELGGRVTHWGEAHAPQVGAPLAAGRVALLEQGATAGTLSAAHASHPAQEIRATMHLLGDAVPTASREAAYDAVGALGGERLYAIVGQSGSHGYAPVGLRFSDDAGAKLTDAGLNQAAIRDLREGRNMIPAVDRKLLDESIFDIVVSPR